MEFKVGICGLGRSAQEFHIPLMKKAGNFRIVAVCDTIPGRRRVADRDYHTIAFSDYRHFLDTDIDLVVIATPSSSHFRIAKMVLEEGKHCVVEKPIALSLKEVDYLIRLAHKKRAVLSVFQSRRFDGDFLTVKRILDEGLLGEPFTIESRATSYGSLKNYGVKEFNPAWRYKKIYGGGILYDFGSHLIDQMLCLAGEPPVSVFCDMKSVLWSREVDDYFKLLIRFRGGMTAHLEASQVSRYNLPRWYALGTKGALLSENGGHPIKVKTQIKGEEFERTYQVDPSRWEQYYMNLYDVLMHRAHPIIKLEEVRKSAAVIDAARISAQKKREETVRY
ncbi:MAG: Gfo/Idh/MocA family oxidoreductase [Candidatus Omnitrophica bacterium]|nr:Gfo/Idh/MocA family oxidoreductase [Candidatus Omnitrophota bacterium]MDD5310989.1 Gfo/Idh/MocA family oxidoreductase [Candidatus Omnitrophota bacterium]MDD5546316.1 Gfo/Idh/MocA family oxidoreductase [Candidatus Omnitrophota bacterium]